MKINEYVPDSSIFDFDKINGSNGNKEDKNYISDFTSVLKNELDQVNNKQIEANNSTEEFVQGDRVDIHNVMLDTEEAKMSLELAVQIRNKFVEAYQELNRTQI